MILSNRNEFSIIGRPLLFLLILMGHGAICILGDLKKGAPIGLVTLESGITVFRDITEHGKSAYHVPEKRYYYSKVWWL